MQQRLDEQITVCYDLLDDVVTNGDQTPALSDTLANLTDSTIGATDCPTLDTSNLESFFGSLTSVRPPSSPHLPPFCPFVYPPLPPLQDHCSSTFDTWADESLDLDLMCNFSSYNNTLSAAANPSPHIGTCYICISYY